MLPEAHSTANFAHYFLPLSTLRFPCKCRIRGCKVRGGGLECRFQNQHLRIQPDSDTNSLTTLKSKLFTYKILLKIHSPRGDHRLIYETRVAQIKKQHKIKHGINTINGYFLWQHLCSSVTKYNVIPYNVGLTSVFSIELSTMNTAINPHSGTFKVTF